MPNILKKFMKPQAEPYRFPSAEELREEAPEETSAAGAGEEREPSGFSDARTPVDYARLQAEAILEDARREAGELKAKALKEAEQEIESLREDARREGYQKGYAQGIKNAASESESRREAEATALGAEVKRFLERATLARENMINETQGELRDLAIAVAEKVVRVSLKSSGEVIARMIQGATEKLKRKEWVHIYIAACDTKEMASVTPGLTMALAALSDHVKIVPMADDESGTCIIEMPDEIIDASASVQLSNIRSLLSEAGMDNR